jgi:hypothetical protein
VDAAEIVQNTRKGYVTQPTCGHAVHAYAPHRSGFQMLEGVLGLMLFVGAACIEISLISKSYRFIGTGVRGI